MEFLSKDPAKALFHVKEELYDRLNVLRVCLGDKDPIDRLDFHFVNEIQFIENLLDKIERS